MAVGNSVCAECEKLQLKLFEKDSEIKKLKLHIRNLTNYLLCKGDFCDEYPDFYDSSINIESIDISAVDQKTYLRDLLLKSRDDLNKHITLQSKSIQTDDSAKSVRSDDRENVPSSQESIPEKAQKHQDGKHADYIYDENYQMYYSVSTGYYYDDKSGLMYEPQSGTYYKYDYDKKEYEKVQMQENDNSILYEDEQTNHICESVVDQVSNLKLNDESAKNEVENNNTLQDEHITEDGKKVASIKSSENDNISLGCAKDWQPEEGSKLTVTDMVKQVVEEHTNMSDYIYDESYRMYYSPSTGYFYDSVRNLLYDPASGIYYSYDSATQKYEFFCQASPTVAENNQTPITHDNVDKNRIVSRRKYWKKKLEHGQKSPKSPDSDDVNNNLNSDEEFSEPEEGEIFSSDEDPDVPVSIVRQPVKSPSLKETSTEELFPPSIRAIVENSENLQIGSLILITCSGGIIGRDKTNAVYLPDVCVSKFHANITFNNDFQTYSIEDLGSQNGTFVNDKRLSEPKLKSEPHILSHGDKLSLGSCKLLLHIHEGYETCDCCEPGQVLAEIASHIEKPAVFISREEKEKMRREEVRRLKKKYGLQGADFERKKISMASEKYEDKAQIRRQTIGSDNPYEKTEEASADVSMSETNKGYQMLKKMGWKEGQTLGKSDSGLVEPIPLCPWIGTAGLGSSVQATSSRPPFEEKKAMKWVKAQERYFQLSSPRDAS